MISPRPDYLRNVKKIPGPDTGWSLNQSISPNQSVQIPRLRLCWDRSLDIGLGLEWLEKFLKTLWQFKNIQFWPWLGRALGSSGPRLSSENKNVPNWLFEKILNLFRWSQFLASGLVCPVISSGPQSASLASECRYRAPCRPGPHSRAAAAPGQKTFSLCERCPRCRE